MYNLLLSFPLPILKHLISICLYYNSEIVGLFLSYHDFLCVYTSRLQQTHLANQSMHWSNTSRTSLHHRPHFSSTRCMNPSETVRILFVDTLSVSVRVFRPLSLTVSGSISRIMMHQHSLWSHLRETQGRHSLKKKPILHCTHRAIYVPNIICLRFH